MPRPWTAPLSSRPRVCDFAGTERTVQRLQVGLGLVEWLTSPTQRPATPLVSWLGVGYGGNGVYHGGIRVFNLFSTMLIPSKSLFLRNDSFSWSRNRLGRSRSAPRVPTSRGKRWSLPHSLPQDRGVESIMAMITISGISSWLVACPFARLHTNTEFTQQSSSKALIQHWFCHP